MQRHSLITVICQLWHLLSTGQIDRSLDHDDFSWSFHLVSALIVSLSDKNPMTLSRPWIPMTHLGDVIKILDLHILFCNLCNFLPFFKPAVFVLFDSFRGCRVVLCSGHPDPVYFRYGSSSPTFDTDPLSPSRSYVLFLGIFLILQMLNFFIPYFLQSA